MEQCRRSSSGSVLEDSSEVTEQTSNDFEVAQLVLEGGTERVQCALTESSATSHNSRDNTLQQNCTSVSNEQLVRPDGRPPLQMVRVADACALPPQRLILTRSANGVLRCAVATTAIPAEGARTSKLNTKNNPCAAGATFELTNIDGADNQTCNIPRSGDAPKGIYDRSKLPHEVCPNKFLKGYSTKYPMHLKSSKMGNRHADVHNLMNHRRALSALPRRTNTLNNGNGVRDKSVGVCRLTTLNDSDDSKWIILQSDTIRRGDGIDPMVKGAGWRPRLHRGRALPPNDGMWQHERQRRYHSVQMSASGFTQKLDAKLGCIPRLLTEPPALPQVLEFALADHYLASLMTCPAQEVERVVMIFAPGDSKEVLSFLRRTYGSHGPASGNNNTPSACKELQIPQHMETAQTAESLARRRRKFSVTMRTIMRSNAPTTGEQVGKKTPPSKHLRTFLRYFIAEVCMSFMDEVCFLCRARSERISSESRGLLLLDEAVISQYEHEVSLLLGQMLMWTEKECARVVPTVARLAKQYLLVARGEGINPR
uniref:Uncharacterized protein n=1 Tax=Trypanosoma congolense (strain IL3000) TaxID=1068625 RepID=G0UQS3_TRYCI|nr:conserved hypothetical protein [Trypanosoma congolense IL3000]